MTDQALCEMTDLFFADDQLLAVSPWASQLGEVRHWVMA